MAALEFPVLFYVHNSIITHGEIGSFLIAFFLEGYGSISLNLPDGNIY